MTHLIRVGGFRTEHRSKFVMPTTLVALMLAAFLFVLTACSNSAAQESVVEKESVDSETGLGANEESSDRSDIEELKDSVSQLKSDAKEMLSGFTEGFSDPSDNVVGSGEGSSEVALDAGGYRVGLDIECERNVFLSTYDVEVLVDGKSVGRIDHGASSAFEVKLAEGTHTLEVFSEDDASLGGSFDFVVSGDMLQNVVLQYKSYGVLISGTGSFSSVEDSLAHLGKTGGKVADVLDFLGTDEIVSYGFDDDEDFLNCRDGEWAARKNFENYGEGLYPEGFDCLWKTGLVSCELREDGAYSIEVEADVYESYDTPTRTYAEGLVSGDGVVEFFVDL